MKTVILKMDENNIDMKLVKVAANFIKNGGIVAFPTETVYGLGANARDVDAINNIFKAKGRPSDNPLIVHVSSVGEVNGIVDEIPNVAKKLMDNFWPGPLTIIMKKKNDIPNETTANLNTVGVRYPSDKVANCFIKECQCPIAAPSANISGKPSPTNGQHVIDDLNGKVDCIITANDSEVGLESTVIDVTVEPPMILRPGGITKEQIEKVIGKVDIDKTINQKPEKNLKPKAPGMKYKHYAPNGQVIIVNGKLENVVEKINQEVEKYLKDGKRVGILATKQTQKYYNYKNVDIILLGDRELPETLASRLFGALRKFDEDNIEIIFAEAVLSSGVGLAVMNRMLKASGFNIIEV